MKSMEGKSLKLNIKMIVAVFAIIIAVLSTVIYKFVDNSRVETKNAEILRSLKYAQVTEDSAKVDNCNYVQFSAFFTKDLDEDGKAEKLLGSCNNIQTTDELYMDLNVLSKGSLKDGVITIEGANFNYSMNMVKDDVLKNTYISDDVDMIELNTVNAGTQKLIIGNILPEIQNNINNYSKVSTITLTGTYVEEDGVTETPISKTINVTVDWYGTVEAGLYENNEATTFYYDYNNLNSTTIAFDLRIADLKNELLLKENVVLATIPYLNGYAPLKVECKNSNVEAEYNNDTKVLTMKRNSSLVEGGQTGEILNTLAHTNTYNVEITYPQEAFDAIKSYTEIQVPIEGYYVGYNNPNEEFTNPYKSNIATGNLTFVFRDTPEGNIYDFEVEFMNKSAVTRPDYKYVISKQDLINMYDNNVEVQNKEYEVRWLVKRGDQGIVNSVVMTETKDETNSENLSYGDKWNDKIMDEYVANTGIYFVGADEILGESGQILVYNNDTNELIKSFTNADWNTYTKTNPYKYSNKIKHVRVETTSVEKVRILQVFHIKELNVEKVLKDFTKEEVQDIETLYTYLTAVCDVQDKGLKTVYDIDYATYVSDKSYADISISKPEMETQEVYDNTIKIKTVNSQVGDANWVNGMFIVEIPEEIINMQINDVSVNDNKVKIVAYDLVKENGKYFIKIITENEEETTYEISINCKLTLDPHAPSCSRTINLYAYNEKCNDYYYEAQDLYDVDSDNITEEKIGTKNEQIRLLSPTSLITVETITNYNNKGEITIAPNVADLEKGRTTATINVDLTNNYPTTIGSVKILGKIPFEGNTYILSPETLGSEFSTTITNEMFKIPTELKDKINIYYSIKENPTQDIQNSENGWTLFENVEDFSKIKTYLIDLKENEIETGKTYTFSYNINVPQDVDYNKVAYSNHAVFFELVTDNGNLELKTEPNKVGIRVSRKYNLELIKYKEETNLPVPGCIYKLIELNEDGSEASSKLLTTNSNGQMVANGIYINKNYNLVEIKSNKNYSLSTDEVVFKVIENAEGNLEFVKISETEFKTPVELTKNSEGEDVLKSTVENKPKYSVKIHKINEQSKDAIKDVYFRIEEIGRTYITDDNGYVVIGNLEQDVEYTLVETKAEGYYIAESVKFKLVKKDGKLVVESSNANFANAVVESLDTEHQIKVSVDIENEKIPTFNLQILKIEETDDETQELIPLKGAEFKLISKDTQKENVYVTDENGNINISDLYIYKEGKNITAEYILQEIKAPKGYANNAERIEFKVVKDEQDKLVVNLLNSNDIETVKKTEVEENVVKFIIENKPLFRLVKIDEQTGEKLEGVEFVIYELNEDGTILDFAKNVNDDYVGIKNSKNQFILKTDKYGKIELPLKDGKYKAVEVKALEGYEEVDGSYVFEVNGNVASSANEIKESDLNISLDTNVVLEIKTAEDLIEFSNRVNNGERFEDQAVVLANTIDLNNVEFIPIGTSSNPFMGTFDGQGYEIRNINVNNDDYAGLFGYTVNAVIKDVGVTGNVQGKNYVAGIVARTTTTSILNSYSNVNITLKENSGVQYVGGVVGELFGGSTAYNCYNNGNLTINNINVNGYIGGVVGSASYSEIISSYNKKDINLSGYLDLEFGGVVGKITQTTVKNCFNEANINIQRDNGGNGNYYIGGIVGNGSSTGTVLNSYNLGKITNYTKRENSYAYIGGIAGVATKVENSYNKGEINSTVECSGYSYISGITNNNSGATITNCYNIADIYNFAEGDSTCSVTINGIGQGTINKCLNSGDIFNTVVSNSGSAYAYINGIGQNSTVTNSYNSGDILNNAKDYNYGTTSISCGIGRNSTVANCYNIGNIINNAKSLGEYADNVTSISSALSDSENVVNSLYLDSAIVLGGTIAETGTKVTDEELKSEQKYNEINVENVWLRYEGEYPKLSPMLETEIVDGIRLNAKNAKKSYKITTTVYGIGGKISGEDEQPYEVVEHGKDGSKEIKIEPDAGFSIDKITINGEEIEFNVAEDGTYIIPAENFKNMQEDKLVVVSFKPKDNFEISKIDEDTQEPIEGAKFVIYTITKDGIITNFAKDLNNRYVGEMNDEGYYIVTTDANGKISLALQSGYYKAVEVEAAEGYVLPGSERARSRYFKVGNPKEVIEPDFVITYVEDLVDLSNRTNAGETFAGKIVTLANSIDFNDPQSYRNAEDTVTYGDYNGDGTVQTIKEELTNTAGKGFKPIRGFRGIFDGQGFEIKNIYIKGTGNSYVGLISSATSATILNLGIVEGKMSYGWPVGGIIAYAVDCEIINCYYKGVLSDFEYAGAIIGHAKNSRISNSYSIITYSGYGSCAGIAGPFEESEMINCYTVAEGNDGKTVAAVWVNNTSSVINTYYLDPTGVKGKTKEQMQSQEFVDLLNSNKTSIEIDMSLANWQYNEGEYPTLIKDENSEGINFIEDGKVTITNKLKDFTTIINKVDEETNEPIPDTKFVIYKMFSEDKFAKDKNGNYVGTLNENGEYVVSTNKNGQIRLELPSGVYKAVEVEAAEGYVLPLREEDRTTYFTVETFVITHVEDLVELSNRVNSGETFEGKTVVLANTIDFNDPTTYRNAEDTESYGDYNGDGTTQSIKEELTATKTSGMKPIGNDNNPFKGIFDGNGFEIKNMQVFSNIQNSYAGLFGKVISGKIENLGVTDIKIISNNNNVMCGGIVGSISNGEIVNCYKEGVLDCSIVTGGGYLAESAGIAGKISNSEIINCHNSGSVNINSSSGGGMALDISNSKVFNCSNSVDASAITYAGGIAKNISGSEIVNCYNTGTITAYSMSGYIGGIANNISGSKLINCYNTGDVLTSNIWGYAGGIANNISGSEIINCYSAGKVESGTSGSQSNNTAGGIASSCSSTSIVNTYYLNTAASTGIVDAVSVTGSVKSQTQSYMQSQTFVNLLNSNRTSIQTDISLAEWKYNSGAYPTLSNVQIIKNEEDNSNSNQQGSGASNNKFITDKNIEIKNNKKKEDNFTINKVDEKDSNIKLPNAEFELELIEDADIDNTSLLVNAGTDNFSSDLKTWKDIKSRNYNVTLNSGTAKVDNYGALVLDGTTTWNINNWNEGSFGTYEITVAIDKDFKPVSSDYWYQLSCVFGCELPYAQKDIGIVINRNGYFAIGYSTANMYTSNVYALDGQYHTITVVYEASKIKFAIDGEIIVTLNYTSSGSEMTKLGVGWNADSVNTAIKGKIKKIKIYNEAISDATIKANHNGTLSDRKILVTDENGTAKTYIHNNEKYVLRELKAPEGYVVTNYSQNINKSNEDLEVTITNIKKENNLIINKVDKETNKPLSNVKFAIYNITSKGVIIDFAKDVYTKEYIGTKNGDGIYVVDTDENGQIKLNLPDGYYKVVEVEPLEGYTIAESTYYKIGDPKADFVITYVEDLVDLSNRVNAGETFEGQVIELATTLDFNNSESYKNAEDTSTYGDYNGDGVTQTIKEELTNTTGTGFKPIGIIPNTPFKGIFNGNGFEIKNIFINITNGTYGGVIGYIRNGAILNLGVVDGNIKSTAPSGRIVGDAAESKIINCYNVGNMPMVMTSNAGGIAGNITNSRMINCFNSQDISAYCPGGLANNASNTVFYNCYNSGNISASSSPASGLIFGSSNNVLNNCYNTGTINGKYGSMPLMYGDGNSRKVNLYYLNTLTNSYGVAKSKEEMQSKEFVELLNSNNELIKTEFDLYNWEYNQGEYPRFAKSLDVSFIQSVENTITNEKKIENNLVIKKVDKTTKQLLSGAQFNISADMNKFIGEIESNSQYKFISYGESGYQSNNYNVSNSVANSYFPIDLRGFAQDLRLTLKVNYTISCQNDNSGFDCGYATITTTKDIPSVNQNSSNINTSYRFIYVGGNYSGSNSITLTGGQKYYLHIGYRKDGSVNTNNDRFYINSIDLEYVNNSIKTNEEGMIKLNVPVGSYTIKETMPPNEYILNSEEQNIKVESYTKVTEVIIENEKEQYAEYNNFVLTKKDRITNEPLAGVKFSILDEQGNYAKDFTGTIIGEKEIIDGEEKYVVTTDENGQVQLKLNIGKYKLVEVKALEGYVVEEPQEFEITAENLNAEIGWSINPIVTHYPGKDYVRVTSDGGLIHTGNGVNKTIPATDTVDNKEIQVTSDKGYIVKYDDKGKVEKFIQIAGYTVGTGIYEDKEGNYIAIGLSGKVEIPAEDTEKGEAITIPYEGTSQITTILKLNSDFKVVWANKFESFQVNTSYNAYIGENKAGNYIISMNRTSNGSSNIYIPAEDTADNKEITMEFDSSKNNIFAELNKEGKIKTIYQIVPNVQGLVEKENGGYVVTSTSSSSIVYDYDANMNLIKESSNLGLSTAYRWPTKDEGVIFVGSVSGAKTISGEYTVDGKDIVLSEDSTSKPYLIKLNKDFKVEWVKIDKLVNYFYCVRQAGDGNYITVAVDSVGKWVLIKYNLIGNVISKTYIKGNVSYPNVIYSNNDATEFALAFSGYTKHKFNENLNILQLEVTNIKNSTVIVHHYLQNTGPEFENDAVVLAEDEQLTGNVTDKYTTAPKLDIEGYILIKDNNGELVIPQNASGEFKDDVQHVYYYYNVAPVELIVHHYLEGTEDKLAEDEKSYYQEGDHYKVTPSEEVLKTYELVEVIGDEEKDITENEVVTYYYKKKQVKITTRVEIPADELEAGRTDKGGEILGEGEEPYETVDYNKNSTKDIIAKPFDGYKLGSITVNGEVVEYTVTEDGRIQIEKFEEMTEDKEVVVTFVPVVGKVITHHYIQGTTEKVHEDIVVDDKVGATVNTSAVNVDGYKLVDSAGNKDEDGNVVITKEVHEGVEEIIYYYQKAYIITTNVIEHTETYKDGTVKNNVKGGDITNEDVVIHELVVQNEDNEKIIEMKPKDNYEIIKVTINGQVVDFEEYSDENTGEEGNEGGSENEEDQNQGETLIEGVTLSSKLKLNEDGSLIIPEKFFKEVQKDIHVEVEYRKVSKVIVKHLEKDTEIEVAKTVEIPGYEGKEFNTSSKIVPGYVVVEEPISEGSSETAIKVTDENKLPTKPNGKMFSDDITIIYWYEKIDAEVVERHIETNEKEDELEIEYVPYKDETAATVKTLRRQYAKFSSINSPENTKEEIEKDYPGIVTFVEKHEDSITVEVDEDNIKEVWYYYIKEYNITTEVKKHKEVVDGVEVEKEGGTISKEFIKDSEGKDVEVTYEVVNSRGDSKKTIKMVPDNGYRIKSVTINNEEIYIDNMLAEDGTLTLPEQYFKDVQQDFHVVVEYERIPAKVIVKYIDEYTKESIIPDKVVEGLVYDAYNEPRVDIDGYYAVEPEPENSEGKMIEGVITIVYYYGKEYKITTDVIEHLEDEEKSIVDVLIDKVEDAVDGSGDTDADKEDSKEESNLENDSNQDGNNTVIPEGKKLVKGGSIQGEDEAPYERVPRGNNSAKEILIKPDDGYRIKSLSIKDGESEYVLSINELLTKENTIILPVEYFKNMQSDKHIMVEFEPIPSKVIVNYFDIATKDSEKFEKVSKSENGEGFVNYDYKTYAKNVPYYELVKEELPENAEGKLIVEDTIVNYWYRKLLFNMKVTKEFSSIMVNDIEQLKDNNKFVKLDIANTDVANTNILVKYKVTVTNTEEVEGIVKLIERIPVGFKFVPVTDANNSVNLTEQWKEVDGRLELTTKSLKPGETVEYEVTLQWDKSMNCIGELSNTVLIDETYNIPEYEETTKEDNKDSCTLIIAIRTRENRDVKTFISMACFVLAGICTVVYIGTEVYARRKEIE